MAGTQKAAIHSTRIVKGDIVPKISLLNSAGQPVDLTDQLIAGNTLALWLLDDKPTKDTRQEMDRFLDQVSDCEVLTFLIIGGKRAPRKASNQIPKPSNFMTRKTLSESFLG